MEFIVTKCTPTTSDEAKFKYALSVKTTKMVQSAFDDEPREVSQTYLVATNKEFAADDVIEANLADFRQVAGSFIGDDGQLIPTTRLVPIA